MRFLLLFVPLCCIAVAGSPKRPGSDGDALVPTYELYSWQGANNEWYFSLLFTTSRQKSVEEVLNEKTALHGLDQLKRKLSKLERSSTIAWADRLTLRGVKVKGSEVLKYPPKKIVDDVKRQARTRNIKVLGP